jgi:type IV pilus assembly protein PilO
MAIDINDLKKMPAKAKVLAVLILILLIGYLDWFYFLSSAMEKKSSLTVQVAELQGKIKEKEKVASQINKYMADVASLQESYKIALQKLPSQREIPSLFHSVAESGKEAGVEFLLFEPKEPKPVVQKTEEESKAAGLLKPSDQKEQKPAEAPKVSADNKEGGKKATGAPAPEPFYEEIPVAVQVVGTFPNILSFFDRVAKLSRIVNVSEISMGEKGKDAKIKGTVIMSSFMIKTYMFIEKKEKAIEKTSE